MIFSLSMSLLFYRYSCSDIFVCRNNLKKITQDRPLPLICNRQLAAKLSLSLVSY